MTVKSMQQTEDGDRQSSLADLLTIETLRILEKDQPRFLPSVDMSLASTLGPQATDNPITAEYVLADRADKILRIEYGLGRSAIAAAIKAVRYGRLAFVVFVTVTAFGICGKTLLSRPKSEPVDVVAFAVFVGINLLMAVPPVFLMIAALIPHTHKRQRGRKGAVAGILEDCGQVASAVYWVFEALISRVSTKFNEQSERSVAATRAASAAAGNLLLRAAAVTSHLCWTIVCGIVLMCFVLNMLRGAYEFTWEETWFERSENRLGYLQNIVAPISWLPWAPTPDDEQGLFEYLTPNQPASNSAQPPRVNQASVCAHLMAAMLLYYGLLPRAVLALIALAQLRMSARKLRPSLTSPYFATIIANLKNPPIGPSSEVAEPTSAPTSAKESGAMGQDAHHVPLGWKSPQRSRSRSLGRSVVFSYEVSSPEEGWANALSLAEVGEGDDLGNANDRASCKRVIGELVRNAHNISNLTIVVDVISAPDNQFISFLSNVLAPLADIVRAETVALLSGGERLRTKFSDDSDRVRTRSLLWRQEIVKCGIREEHVLEFDHLSATAQSRQDLLKRLKTIREASSHASPSTLGLRLGGRFAQARRLIYDSVESIAGSADPDRLAAETKELHQRIHGLYEQGPTLFARRFAQFAEMAPSLNPALDTASTQASALFADLSDKGAAVAQMGKQTAEQVRQSFSRFMGHFAGLDYRWLAAIGVAGAVSMPVALGGGLAAVLAGGLSGAAAGIPLSMLAGKLGRVLKGPNQKITDPPESKYAADGFSLDDLVRAAVVWTVVLELQGNPEDVIITTLQRLLSDCHPQIVDSPIEANALLDNMDERLQQLSSAKASK